MVKSKVQSVTSLTGP